MKTLDIVMDGYTFTVEIDMTAISGAIGKLTIYPKGRPDVYCESFTWCYMEETLEERLDEIRHDIADDYTWFAINYYQKNPETSTIKRAK